MTKGIYGQDVKRLNISLPPRYVRELDRLAATYTRGNRSAMIRYLIGYRLRMEGRGKALMPDDGAPTRQ